MKISIFYKYTNNPYGGSNNFLRRLGNSWSNMGIDVEYGYNKNSDAVLLNAFIKTPDKNIRVEEIQELNATGKMTVINRIPGISFFLNKIDSHHRPLIVHRMDGVTQLYGRKNPYADQLAMKINQYADLTIYQSQFCQDSFQSLGLNSKRAVIIHNGVPSDIFYPGDSSGSIDNKIKFLAVSWSSNLLKGYETLAHISMIEGVQLSFIGNWPDQIPQKKVQILGPKRESEIASLLRTYDAFIHAAYNEPSSNSIIEAMASGLPVLYRDSGGNKEIVKNCGVPIHEDLTESVKMMINQYSTLRKNTLEQRPRFLIENIAKSYQSSIELTLSEHK